MQSLGIKQLIAPSQEVVLEIYGDHSITFYDPSLRQRMAEYGISISPNTNPLLKDKKVVFLPSPDGTPLDREVFRTAFEHIYFPMELARFGYCWTQLN